MRAKKSTLSFVRAIRRIARTSLWKSVAADEARGHFLVHRDDGSFTNLNPVFADPLVNASLKRYSQGVPGLLQHNEYVMHCTGKVFIEPRSGWWFRKAGTYLKESLPYAYQAQPPGTRTWVLAKCNLARLRRVNRIISLRDVGEGNYYHCYNDALCKLALLDAVGIPRDVPVLVSRRTWEKPYFRELVSRGELSARNWLVADGMLIEAQEAWCCKIAPCRRKYFDYLLRWIDAPDPDPNASQRIFLQRSASSGRTIGNQKAVDEVLSEFGFRSVDAAEMSVEAQMSLFSKTRFVIAVHGAGLTNIIFRRGADMGILEIFPPNNIPPMYWWLSLEYGYHYDALLGDPINPDRPLPPFTQNMSFLVNPDVLRHHIKNLLSA